MRLCPSSPPLIRSIFVAPSSTILVHHATEEWDAMRERESHTSPLHFPSEETQVRSGYLVATAIVRGD